MPFASNDDDAIAAAPLKTTARLGWPDESDEVRRVVIDWERRRALAVRAQQRTQDVAGMTESRRRQKQAALHTRQKIQEAQAQQSRQRGGRRRRRKRGHKQKRPVASAPHRDLTPALRAAFPPDPLHSSRSTGSNSIRRSLPLFSSRTTPRTVHSALGPRDTAQLKHDLHIKLNALQSAVSRLARNGGGSELPPQDDPSWFQEQEPTFPVHLVEAPGQPETTLNATVEPTLPPPETPNAPPSPPKAAPVRKTLKPRHKTRRRKNKQDPSPAVKAAAARRARMRAFGEQQRKMRHKMASKRARKKDRPGLVQKVLADQPASSVPSPEPTPEPTPPPTRAPARPLSKKSDTLTALSAVGPATAEAVARMINSSVEEARRAGMQSAVEQNAQLRSKYELFIQASSQFLEAAAAAGASPKQGLAATASEDTDTDEMDSADPLARLSLEELDEIAVMLDEVRHESTV